ncbi:MAG: ATP-binding protein [Iphinoe sp. HA4291-MV1]|jgi:hypothetical protein|nr:ATP-binding protein [Iphinoe sp. HA4291-MV1]
MHFNSFSRLEELIVDKHPLIACESPLQERHRILVHIASYCQQSGKQCYIWNLSEDSVKELYCNSDDAERPLSPMPAARLRLTDRLRVGAACPPDIRDCAERSAKGNRNLMIKDCKEYVAPEKNKTEDYFHVLKFWRNYSEPGILIIENIFPWIQENRVKETDFFLISEWIKTSLINIKLNNQDTGKTAILLGDSVEISSNIAAEIPLFTQELPDINEIIDILSQPNILPKTYSSDDFLKVAAAGVGMYTSDIINGLKEVRKRNDLSAAQEVAKLLLDYKIKLLSRLYDIDFVPPPKVELGGLELMQESFKKFKRLLSPRAKQYNLRVPKGIMLVGPPGTGKSHSAKVCAQEMSIPLIMVDWGNFRSFGDQAQAKLKRLLRLADTVNQLILYFDDCEKGFAGDDDLSRRLTGLLLTWMQERTSDVVVIASVNRIEWLPPELTRAGRFDYLFKVDLPNNGERYSIFKFHAARFDKRFRNGGDPWTEEEWRRILKATNRCVGAEIQTIVERAAATIFCNMVQEDTQCEGELPPLKLTINALLEERRQMNPLAIREADRVESMRNKADAQALPSSPKDESIFAISNIDIFS